MLLLMCSPISFCLFLFFSSFFCLCNSVCVSTRWHADCSTVALKSKLGQISLHLATRETNFTQDEQDFTQDEQDFTQDFTQDEQERQTSAKMRKTSHKTSHKSSHKSSAKMSKTSAKMSKSLHETSPDKLVTRSQDKLHPNSTTPYQPKQLLSKL